MPLLSVGSHFVRQLNSVCPPLLYRVQVHMRAFRSISKSCQRVAYYGRNRNETKQSLQMISHYFHCNTKNIIGYNIVGTQPKQIICHHCKNFSVLFNQDAPIDRLRHDPHFMDKASPQEKEQWLKSTIEKASLRENNVDGKYLLDKKGFHVDSLAYRIVLKSWSTSGLNSAPHKCEEILSRLERHYDAAKKMYEQLTTNKESTNNINDIDLIRKLMIDLQPTVECYNDVIRAWSNTNNPIIARAERWLDTMRRNREYYFQFMENNKDDSLNNIIMQSNTIPNTESYNLFLSIISKGNAKKSQVLIDNATKAQNLLQEMISIKEQAPTSNHNAQPNTDSFNFVLRAITRCRLDPEITKKMMDTLRLMELLQRNADDPEHAVVKPNTMTYCMALDAFGISAYQKASSTKQKKRKEDSNILNMTKDDSFLNDEEDDPYKDIQRAESILKYMHDLNDFGNFDVVPNTIAYNTIISAYGRISSEKYPDAPMHAESVLRRMIEKSSKEGEKNLIPDTRTFNALIKCWANAKQSNSGSRAEWWLRRMWSDGDTNPDVNTYNGVILAFLNISQALEAERLLEELIEIESTGEIKPNSETFSLVIRSLLTYAQNTLGHEAIEGCHRAHKWLSVLLDREESSEDFTSSPELFSQIIKSIEIVSRGTQDKALLHIALKTFSKLKNSRHHADSMSYTCLLRIGLNTLSEPSNSKGRNKFIHTVISSCCDDGFVSNKFIAALSEKTSKVNWEGIELKAIGQHYFSDWPLPNNWYRNVDQHSRASRRDCEIFLIHRDDQE